MANLTDLEIGTIVRHINFQRLDGNLTVSLEQFKTRLYSVWNVDQLNNCLKKHGFKGKVRFFDSFVMYEAE